MIEDIILYGAALIGQTALNYYGLENVKCFCDGAKEKIGTEFCGLPVISLEQLVALYKTGDYRVIITSNKYLEIGKILRHNDIIDYKVFRINELMGGELYTEIRLKETIEYIRNCYKKERNIREYEKHTDFKYKIAITYYGNVYDKGQESFINALRVEKNILIQRVVMDKCEVEFQELKKEAAIEYILQDEYDAALEKPDIFIYTVPDSYRYEDRLTIDYLKSLNIYTILLNSATMIYDNSPNYISNLLSWGIWEQVDLVITHNNYYNLKNAVELPNPKFDMIFDKLNSAEVPEEWIAKIRRRKVILWNFVHGLGLKERGAYYSGVTFDYFLRSFIELAYENQDMIFLLRPHPALFIELVKYDYWSPQELYIFKDFINKSNNIILDETDDYGNAYYISDALISDKSGLLSTYLPLLRPIMYLPSPRDIYPFYHNDMKECFYIGNEKDDIQNFLDIIKNNADNKLKLRENVFKKNGSYFDGNNGERLKLFIINKLKKL